MHREMRFFSLPSLTAQSSPMPPHAFGTEVVSPDHLVGVLTRLPGILSVYSQTTDPAARHFLARLAIILVEGGLSCADSWAPGSLRFLRAPEPGGKNAFHVFGAPGNVCDRIFGCERPGNKVVWPLLMEACRHLLRAGCLPARPLNTFLEAKSSGPRPGVVVCHPYPAPPVSAPGTISRKKPSWKNQSYRSTPHTTSTMRLWKE